MAVNLVITGTYTIFTLLLVNQLIKIKNFDQTQKQTYLLKVISVFMVSTSTLLQMPVFISIFVVIKALSLGLGTQLYILMIFSNSILIIEFTFVLIYSLKFFNLEIPNDEIPWSHNQTSGIYLKVILKVVLCT